MRDELRLEVLGGLDNLRMRGEDRVDLRGLGRVIYADVGVGD